MPSYPPVCDLPPHAGEYTAERLKELQNNARSVPASAKPAAPAFKLSGSFKPAAPPKDDRFQYNVSAAAVVRPPAEDLSLQRPSSRSRGGGGAPGDMPLPPPSEPPPPAAGAPPPSLTQQATAAAAEDEDDESDIPDEEMIAWAKAKRERLRGAHLAPDYIPTASLPPGLSRWVACGAQHAVKDRGWDADEAGCDTGWDADVAVFATEAGTLMQLFATDASPFTACLIS